MRTPVDSAAVVRMFVAPDFPPPVEPTIIVGTVPESFHMTTSTSPVPSTARPTPWIVPSCTRGAVK
ncbi:hypothetical protein Ae406Ps2_6451 [Pseudonocardia sp. Ae406_Ps2]|nr:hypothetical protein Ae406Ps2_6451 [Pseudonocardia sp. Ae406_Ps2]